MTDAATAPQPQEVVMQMIVGGWVAKTLSEITALDVPDHLKKHGPLTAQQLVDRKLVKAHPEALHRALRACAAVGIFTEDAKGRYGITPLSDALTLDSPVSVKKIAEIAGQSWYDVWRELGRAIRTGKPQCPTVYGMDYWDWLKANPKEMELFGEVMKANSTASLNGVLNGYDFSGYNSIADIGGGFGHLALALLAKYPNLNATVLDMPDMVRAVKKHLPKDKSVTDRFTFAGGDMFKDVPKAEVYIMKHIIHDWDDARCVKLLKHCVKRMQGRGRVLCVDAVLPPTGDTSGAPAKFLDLDMLVFIPGKERTLAQWKDLYKQAGLKIGKVIPLHDNFGTSIVEGIKA